MAQQTRHGLSGGARPVQSFVAKPAAVNAAQQNAPLAGTLEYKPSANAFAYYAPVAGFAEYAPLNTLFLKTSGGA
jgi:hypothetical protein